LPGRRLASRLADRVFLKHCTIRGRTSYGRRTCRAAGVCGTDRRSVVTDLAKKVTTAKPTVVFTAETDPKQAPGRPNGYTSKASFADSRIKTSEVKDDRTGSVDQGGSVKVYPDEARAAARKKFVDDTTTQ
jgi:hypothetical protein